MNLFHERVINWILHMIVNASSIGAYAVNVKETLKSILKETNLISHTIWEHLGTHSLSEADTGFNEVKLSRD